MGIVQTIFAIANKFEPSTEFTINITGGTKLISAAAYYSSYYIRAVPWYSQYITDENGNPIEEECGVFPIKAPMAIDMSNYSQLSRRILKFIYEWEQRQKDRSQHLTNQMIADNFGRTKQSIGHHIKNLKEDGLIDIEKVGRDNKISLTEHGIMMARYAIADDLNASNRKK